MSSDSMEVGKLLPYVTLGSTLPNVDFAGRIEVQSNFTNDIISDVEDATDSDGYGINVGGNIVADGDDRSVAPGSNIIPLKVLSLTGGDSIVIFAKAMGWILDHRKKLKISAVCISLGAVD